MYKTNLYNPTNLNDVCDPFDSTGTCGNCDTCDKYKEAEERRLEAVHSLDAVSTSLEVIIDDLKDNLHDDTLERLRRYHKEITKVFEQLDDEDKFFKE